MRKTYIIREVEPETHELCDPELMREFKAFDSIIQMLYTDLVNRGCDNEQTREQILMGSFTASLKKAALSWQAR